MCDVYGGVCMGRWDCMGMIYLLGWVSFVRFCAISVVSCLIYPCICFDFGSFSFSFAFLFFELVWLISMGILLISCSSCGFFSVLYLAFILARSDLFMVDVVRLSVFFFLLSIYLFTISFSFLFLLLLLLLLLFGRVVANSDGFGTSSTFPTYRVLVSLSLSLSLSLACIPSLSPPSAFQLHSFLPISFISPPPPSSSTT